ncbi:unnamed protein product [Closterium sp. NIES-65]|nr:unnamed protein product [Closterium sp. NIES-65]
MTERNLWGFFDGSASKPTSDASTAEKEAWVRKDKKGFAFLVSKLSLQLVPIVSPCIDRDGATREAWKRLEGEHVSKSLHSKLQARLDFFTVRMKDGESMCAYVNRVEELGERLVELDASVEDNDWIMTLLAGLGEAWSTVITVLDGTQDTWKKEQVVARLINEEARRAKLHGDAIGAAHFSRDAKAKGSGHFKRRNDGNNRGSSNGSAAASSSSRGGSANANRARAREGACRFCKKTGHWWRDCPVKPANWRPSSSDDNRRAHVATCDNDDREFVFVASGTTVGGVDAWVLDTGATQHMTASATLLNNVTTVAPVKRVMFGNRDTLDVTGQGDLRLMVDGGPLTIKNVLVVPGLGANLLSVSQFTRKGMRVNIEGSTMVLSTADGVHIGTAVTLATWIRNRCVTKALPNTTPLEAWSGTKPDVTDLRTFGCTCYYHVPDATRTKLEAKARVAMYLGPSADHKAWRVWDLEHGKLVVSRDVVFYEDTFPSKSMHVPSVIIDPPSLDAADEADVAPTASPPRTSEGENGSGAVGVSADEEHAKESDPSSPPPKITPTLASTRTRRTPRPNFKLDGYSLVAGDDEGGGDAMCLEAYTDTPSTYQGAMSSAEAAEWERALQEEYDSLMANDVYELVPMPPGAYLVGSRWTLVADVKTKLAAEFSMRDLGAVSHYLGMHIDRDRGNKTLALHQHKYLESVVDRFGMIESKPTPTPMEAVFHPLAVSDEKPMDPESAKTFHSVVGSCMYAAVSTRPALSFPVGVLGRVVSNPMVEHATRMRIGREILQPAKALRATSSPSWEVQ